MPGKRLAALVLVSVCFFLADASAQTNEVAGLFGRTLITDRIIVGSLFSDNRLRFGKGATLELNYARNLLRTDWATVSMEVPFVFNPDEDWHTHTSPLGNYQSFFITPAGRVNLFTLAAVSPWVSAGGGFGHFSGHYAVTGSNGTTNFGNTVGVFQAGLGLDVRLVRSFKLRAEARDFWSGRPAVSFNTGSGHQRNLFVGAGLMWQF